MSDINSFEQDNALLDLLDEPLLEEQFEDEPPCGFAHPDNQGPYNHCTRYALSKGIVDGCMRKIFVRNKEVDFDQEQVTDELLR